ncbi:MAG TPA: hypothetical protein VGF75_01510 [Candidatus Saccharimonadales bacterium]
MDPLKYMAAAVIESYDKATEVVTVQNSYFAYRTINVKIRGILDRCKATKYECYLTKIGDKTNLRNEIYDLYKKNRTKTRKPVCLQEMHDYIEHKHKAHVSEGEEADDAITIRQYELNSLGFDKKNINSVIVSIDKDFNNVPGWHYNPNKDTFKYINELNAKKNFYLQILTGDSADNVPRLKNRWLKATAEEAIRLASSEKEVSEIVLKEVMKVKETSEQEARKYIEMIGRLVWLRTKKDEMWRFEL